MTVPLVIPFRTRSPRIDGAAWVASWTAPWSLGKRVPKGQLWAGTPARYLRDVAEEEARYIKELPRHYAALAAAYR